MKKLLTFLVLFSASVSIAAERIAPEGCVDCFNFKAPSVLDKDSVNPAEIGQIVHDTNSNTFEGYNGGGSWQGFGVPPGTIVAFGGTTAPGGWHLCDGTSYPVSGDTRLHSAIGDAFGGDGGTNFNVPDLRGRFLRGVDNGSTNDPDRTTRTAMNSGGNTGDAVGSLQEDQFENHAHGGFEPKSAADGSQIVVLRQGSGTNTSSAGGAETRPKNAYVNYIIKR